MLTVQEAWTSNWGLLFQGTFSMEPQLKYFGCGRAGHQKKDCATQNPGIAGVALEKEPANGKCSAAQMLPQDVNEANRIE